MKRLLLLCLLLSISNLIFAQGYAEIQKVIASDSGNDFYFGYDVAIQGDVAVIGSKDATYQGVGPLGVAYIFKKNNNGFWAEHQLIVSPDSSQFDSYGISVAIDGDYIVIGAIGEKLDLNGENPLTAAGAAYIYKNDGNDNWNLHQKIIASDRTQEGYFGFSVAINNNYMVIGAGRDDYDENGENFQDRAGAAYIFEKDNTDTWDEVAKVVAPDRATNDRFGYAVSIYGDYASVGAYAEDEDENGNNTVPEAGSVYVYKRATNGDWNFQKKLVPDVRPDNSERLGWALDMDGDYIVAGAHYADEPNSSNGAFYLFKRDINDTWSQVDKFVNPDGIQGEGFGYDVAIDGDRILVGAYQDYLITSGTTNVHGTVYYYTKETGIDTWIYQNKTLESNWQDSEQKNFGFAVDLDDDTAIVGDWISDAQDSNTTEVYNDAGAAYFLEFDPNLPVLSINITDDISVTIYPNPVQDYLNINFEEHYGEVKITIYDMLGKLVLSKRYNSRSALSLPFHVEKGFYVVKIQSENNKVSTLKIVKQ